MINTPLVSIIVVSYNHQKFITENLDSIKNQTYKNIELIVADDASSDSSTEVFDKWLTENNWSAKKNYHSSNTGLAQTLNECLKMIAGKYVKLIAADDYLHSDYISECVSFLESEKKLAVYTQADLVDENSKIMERQHFPNVNYNTVSEMRDKLFDYNFIPGATFFSNAEIYPLVGEYPKSTLLEDYNLAFRIASRNLLIGNITKSLVYYRSHDRNISKERKDWLDMQTIKEKVDFDSENRYGEIIGRNIRKEIIWNNIHVKELRKIYTKVKMKENKTLFALYLPRLFRFTIALKEKISKK